MSRRPLYRAIRDPAPPGWTPKRGDQVIVAARGDDDDWHGWRAVHSAVVERVIGDVVTVRVPAFRLARWQVLVGEIRPHPWRTGSCFEAVGGEGIEA